MLKIHLRTTQGELVGRVDDMSLEDFLARIENQGTAFIAINDPGLTTILQEPVLDEKGNIKLVDGTWVTEAQARANGLSMQHVAMRNILRIVLLKSPVTGIRASIIEQVRELSTTESDEYSRAVQELKLGTTALATGMILPENIRNE